MEWAPGGDDRLRALAAFTGVQALWISRALDRVHAALDQLDARLDRVEGVVLRDLSERVAPRGRTRLTTGTLLERGRRPAARRAG